MQRRMLRVFFQELESFVSEIADGSRRRVEAGPEIRRDVVIQSLVDWPEAFARRAFSANASSVPAFTSASN